MKKELKKPAMQVNVNVKAYEDEITNQSGCSQNLKNCAC